MRRIAVAEHTRVGRGASAGAAPSHTLEEHLYDRLRRFDCDGRPERERVFDWRDGHMRTTQWVGVVQVPGIQIEILPKVDAVETGGDWEQGARTNLLCMLAEAGDVPVRSRDLARLATRKAPLSETLAAIFADRLRQELLRGPERAYQQREENLRIFKGKLLIAEHTRRNAAQRERFFCRFDELSDDTTMNRIFRSACRALLGLTETPATQDALRDCLLLLDGASDVVVQDADFNAVAINRQNERFAEILRFCRLVLAGRTPTVQAGGTRSFSLLFDMNKVFERFVAALLCRRVVPRLGDVLVHPQAARRHRHLMQCDGAGVLRLTPDILIEGHGQRLVMDTKWKLLSTGKRGRGGVADGDLYQLYAYTRRYGCRRSVLLYPLMPGVEPRDFDILNEADQLSGERVAIRQIRIYGDLHSEAERERLVTELEGIVREGLGLSSAAPLLADGSTG